MLQILRKTKIAQFDFPLVDKDVGGFEISVYDSVIMGVFDPKTQLYYPPNDLLLFEKLVLFGIFSDYFGQVLTICIFQNQNQLLAFGLVELK